MLPGIFTGKYAGSNVHAFTPKEYSYWNKITENYSDLRLYNGSEVCKDFTVAWDDRR